MNFASISTVHARPFYKGGSPTSETLRRKWSEPISTKIESLKANRVVVDILKVSKRAQNWDGFGSKQPDAGTVSTAVSAVDAFVKQVSQAGLEWLHPYVGSNENGEISFEWWSGDKKLIVYIGAEENNYVSSWGHNIETHMDAGPLPLNGFLKQWRWLTQLHN